jgi:hypothetical protein
VAPHSVPGRLVRRQLNGHRRLDRPGQTGLVPRLSIRFTIIIREQFKLSVHDRRAWSAAQAPLLRRFAVRCARRAGGEPAARSAHSGRDRALCRQLFEFGKSSRAGAALQSRADATRVDQTTMRDNSGIPWRRITRRITAACRAAVACTRASSRSAFGYVRPGARNSDRGPLLAARLFILCALGCAMALSGCAPGSAQLESKPEPVLAAAASPTISAAPICRPDRALLAPQPAPDCGFAWSNLKTLDPDQWARLKLEYERKCYQNAEKIARERLRQLQAAITCEVESARQ